jgi:hypothetical protein
MLCIVMSFGDEAITQSRLAFDAQYYGLPLTLRGGYLYRTNNFSLFPNGGARITQNDTIAGDVFSAFTVQYHKLTVEPSFHYEVVSQDMREKDGKAVYYVQNTLAYGFASGGLSFLTQYGKHRWRSYQGNETGELYLEDTLTLRLALDFFLCDTGLFRGTVKTALSYQYVLDARFNSYDIRMDIPLTFSLYYVDIGLIYTAYYTGILDYLNEANTNYVIEKPYSAITGRYGFKGTEGRYTLFNVLEMENRWYFLRGSIPASQVFASVFGSLGLGINRSGTPVLLGQTGLGLGYLLFDCVPFTVQVGYDTRGNLVFYTGIVSRIAHF